MQVKTIQVTNGGTGYTSVPAVRFACAPGCTGSGAAATASIADGKIQSVKVDNGGNGYDPAPTVTFSGGGGNGATATASVS